jgi:ABC-type lipoprotein release transport system permease subunit
MFAFGYAWNELRRRWSRTVVTAIGLAAGVGLVMGIVGVSDGLTQAQNKVLSPLSSVGTDIIVTRTVDATPASSSGSTTTTTPTGGGFGGGGGGFGGTGGGGGGGGFFGAGAGRGRGGAASITALNASDQAALLNANSSVLTDLSKLGPAGTQFTYDFFVPGTLITFPQAAVADVASIKGVASAVPGLSLQALHETGTVPTQTDTVTTGGQTISSVAKPAPLTAAQSAAVRSCIEASGAFGTGSSTTPSTTTPTTAPGATTGTTSAGATPSTTAPGGSGGGRGLGGGGGGGGGGGFGGFGGSAFGSAITKCLPASYQQYEAKVVVPEQTITRVLNPPSTNTETKSYTVAGVNPADTSTGLITTAQVVSGKWFGAKPADEILVNTAYASTNSIKVGQQLTIDKTTFSVVGLVNPTLTGDTSDIYFDLSTLQTLGSNTSRVNEVLVKVAKSSDVTAVAAAIHKELPGAQVLTDKELSGQVTGSLSNAHTLATHLGGALAVIVLLAAFLIAALLTLSSIAKRVREIGTLRAIGWSRGRVVRQIVGETVGIGILGGILGVGLGVAVCAVIGAVGPALSSTSSVTPVGASTVGAIFHQATTAAQMPSKIHLRAPIDIGIVLLGLGSAVVGGLIAGAAGGWRASRLAPAEALRDLG